jgi:epoxyqueuosine reductase
MAEGKIENQIKDFAFHIGFSHVGICSVQDGEEVPHLREWLEKNYHGQMKYMENARRHSPSQAFSGLHSMIVVGMNYRWSESSEREQEAMISKYAWTEDYHEVMRPMLFQLSERVKGLAPGSDAKVYVDTGPIVEKHWAQKAGIGWIGKHTNVISMKGSSWIFLGEILTDLVLEGDVPALDHCGSCTKCIKACPTGAIVAPYVLDARLCISYLTIELRESIPRELRAAIGHRIFGCDDCQDVCPWNRFAYAGDPRFTPRTEVLSASLIEYLRLTPDAFRRRFAGTNVLRAKFRGFIRNCLVAAGNSKKPELIPEIRKHLASEDEMIREHALWALEQFESTNNL